MDERVAAWLAGLVDGEGSIYVAVMEHSPNAVLRSPSLGKRPRYRVALSIAGTSPELMDAIMERVGMGVVYHHRRAEKENHKSDAYTWRLNATQMPEVLPHLIPWLVVKKEQAELALEWCALRKSNSPVKGEVWDRLDPEQYHGRLSEIAAEIKRLNTRGRKGNG